MDLEEQRRERVERYARRVELRRKEKQRSKKKIARGERRGVRPRMKRKETIIGGCAGKSALLERSTKGDRSSKRRDVRSRVSSEDTWSSGSRVKEDEVRFPWSLRDATDSKEEGAKWRR
jgi:hypothetical protein